MNEENLIKTKENTKETEAVSRKRVVKFKEPYRFETAEYKEIDLSGLDDLSTDDLLKAESMYLRSGGTSINPETTMLYSMILAHIANGVPIEFFGKLPAREAMKIKKEVYLFFYGRG